MLRQAEVIVRLPVASSVQATFRHDLEVSLDCLYCRRAARTVIFVLGAESARCCPGSATRTDEDHPPYPGRLVAQDVGRDSTGAIIAVHRLEYDVSPFDDAKYGPEARPWTGYPTWARVTFSLDCPKCGSAHLTSTQNNLMRPVSFLCECGYSFFTERREQPRLRWLDPDRDNWIDVPERFGAPDGPLARQLKGLSRWFSAGGNAGTRRNGS